MVSTTRTCNVVVKGGAGRRGMAGREWRGKERGDGAIHQGKGRRVRELRGAGLQESVGVCVPFHWECAGVSCIGVCNEDLR